MVLELRVDALDVFVAGSPTAFAVTPLLGVLVGVAALMAALRGFELWAMGAVARADARALAKVARRNVDGTVANRHD